MSWQRRRGARLSLQIGCALAGPWLSLRPSTASSSMLQSVQVRTRSMVEHNACKLQHNASHTWPVWLTGAAGRAAAKPSAKDAAAQAQLRVRSLPRVQSLPLATQPQSLLFAHACQTAAAQAAASESQGASTSVATCATRCARAA